MKRRLTIIATFVICCFAINSVAQDTLKKTPGFNARLGFIICNSSDRYEKFMDGSSLYGINFSANRIVKKKFLLGISADIGSIQKGGYTTWAFGDVEVSKSTGTYANIFVTTTGYIFGNSITSKAGLYIRFGLGIVWDKVKYTLTHEQYHIIDNVEDTYFNFSAQLCLGGDVKLGLGRLFVEIVSMPVIAGTLTEKETIGSVTDTYKYKTNITQDYSGEFGGRIGYLINF